MCMKIKVNNLPSYPITIWTECAFRQNWDMFHEVEEKCSDYVFADYGRKFGIARSLIENKYIMICELKDYFSKNDIAFDEFHGLPPTRINFYKAYEFSTVWFWTILIKVMESKEIAEKVLNDGFYNKYKGVISSVFGKYPKITLTLIGNIDLRYPDNKFYEIAMEHEDNADFDGDSTDEVETNEQIEKFKDWLFGWTKGADSKSRMRVDNWFKTKKSHKQIQSEINRVKGNEIKFNTRLALFIERLFNKEDVSYFYEKTGFNSKEEMLMTYFDNLTDYDYDTKMGFIKKYLV